MTGYVFIDEIQMSRWLARESRRRMPMQHRVNKARAQTAGRSRALHDLLPQGWPWSRPLQGNRGCCKESEPDPRPFLIVGFLAAFGNFWPSLAIIPVASLDRNTSAGPVRRELRALHHYSCQRGDDWGGRRICRGKMLSTNKYNRPNSSLQRNCKIDPQCCAVARLRTRKL